MSAPVARLIQVLSLWLLLFASAQSAWSAELEGKVIAIADGDTLTVLLEGNTALKVRLAGIDCPERGQAFYQVAKSALSNLVFGKTVTVVGDRLDRYDRFLGKILLDGRDVNLQMVQDGLAWWYRKYAKDQTPADRSDYENAEIEARSERRGLWADPTSIPPWEWRQRARR